MNEFETDLAQTEASMNRLLKLFTVTLLVLILGVGGWAVASKVESAVIATGNFVVSSNGQAVQHLHGGVVGRILVKDGDRVKKGQLVIELDSAKVRAELGIIKRQLIDLAAERARLIAERDGQVTIKRPKILQGNAANSSALNAALMLQQTRLQSRTDAFRSQLMQLKEQMEQTKNGIAGLRSLKRAREEELAQVSDDLEAYLQLDRKRLIRRSVLRQTKRQVSRLRGDIMEITSRLSSHQSKQSETEFRMREIKRKTRSEILDHLRLVKSKIGEALEKYSAARDRMTRLEIRAPSSGIVHEMNAHTVGGVISPGQRVMQIVPDNDSLLVMAKIEPNEVDQVKIGQRALVRVSAFDQQAPPELDGSVVGVSPDRSQDERTGIAYFSVRIAIDAGQSHKLGQKHLTPGLPADVFIRGQERRVISYLTQPIREQMSFAMREE